MSKEEFNFSGWSVEDGYQEFVEHATLVLSDIGHLALNRLIKHGLHTIQESLWHPNGFLYRHLVNENESQQLRLHIWPTGRVDDLTPHSHPWHMVGLALAGDYREYIPEVKLDDEGEHKLMGTSFGDDRRQHGNDYTGRNVNFELGQVTNYGAGSYHCLPAGEFHVTPLPDNKPIVTLVRTGKQLFDTPTYVLRELNQELQLTNVSDRLPPSKNEAQRIWEELQPVLEAAKSSFEST